jgi:hypothetical protein
MGVRRLLPPPGSSTSGTAGNDPFTKMVDHIVAETAKDPSYPFQPNVSKLLAEIKRKARAAFEQLRERLRENGFRRWSELEKLVDAEIRNLEEAEKTAEQRDADALLRTAKAEVALFHSPDKRTYADVRVNKARETWPLMGTGFRRWLRYKHRIQSGGDSISDTALSQAIKDLDAEASYDSPEREVFVRVAQHDGVLYIDLADESWRAIEIDESGWRIDPEPPVRFRRSAGMLPLPEPQRGGDIADLDQFLNLGPRDRALFVAYIQAALRPMKEYPVLPISGEQGAGKTTLCEIVRALVDPSKPATTSFPRSEENLVVHANNSHLLVFDNISSLQGWQSDALCRLSTSSGFHKRQLFSDGEEWTFDGCRPVMLNGIEDILSHADLIDRSTPLVPDPLDEDQRMTKEEFWAEFEKERPRIVGAFLDSLSDGLRRLPSVKLHHHKPRMLDFAKWGVACEQHNPATFEDAYFANRRGMLGMVLEQDAVAKALVDWVATWSNKHRWRGNATLLYRLLEKVRDQLARWPRTAHHLSGRLRRAAPNLRHVGIDVKFDDGRERLITITAKERAQRGERGG